MKKVGKYTIPFQRWPDGHCSMMEYTTADEGETGTSSFMPQEWRENTVFKATLQLAGHWRGRSAARVGVLNVDNGEKYSMGLGGFYDAVTVFGVKGSKITGTWAFRKQGANYAVYPIITEGVEP